MSNSFKVYSPLLSYLSQNKRTLKEDYFYRELFSSLPLKSLDINFINYPIIQKNHLFFLFKDPNNFIQIKEEKVILMGTSEISNIFKAEELNLIFNLENDYELCA